VGYQVRFERRVSAATRIEVITEGLLARRLQQDPELPGVGLVIFDEFHERSLDADLGLALTLDARATLNPALRVLVMSATLDADAIAGRLDAPRIDADGRLFPVEVRYRPPRSGEDPDDALVATIRHALAEHDGDALIFLPGAGEIRRLQSRLESVLGEAVAVMPLYGELSAQAQDAALSAAPDGRRRVVLSTNLAQTSLTVEGVAIVIDSGLVRVAVHDLASGANRLETQRVSRAAADQRAGRAGRLGPGVCCRLWSQDQHGQLAAHDRPEILTADLGRLALEMAAWGARAPSDLMLLDEPPATAWTVARNLLADLGALDAEGRITVRGRALLALPLDPRRAALLLAARELGHAATGAWITAVLDERGPGSLDLAERVAAAVAGRLGDAMAQRRLRDTVQQLLRLVDVRDDRPDLDAVPRLIARAWPERIARQREGRVGVFQCADGSEARLPERSELAQVTWLCIAHWDPGPPRRVRAACAIDEAALLADQAERLQWHDHVAWDPQTQAVLAEQRRSLGAIVLARRPLRDATEAQRRAMLAGIASLGLDALPWTDAARRVQARIESLRRWHPDEDWPASDDASLLAGLERWLGPWLDGVTRRDHLARLDLASILLQQLDYPAQQALARRTPTQLAVPSGSRVTLDYQVDGEPPVLPVKLQELFGLDRTPAVDDGRMPVMLHLLSPARRPIQVTRDLAGFWDRTYAEVRKELKGRYPKHPWPDDPRSATPTARAKPRS